MVNLNLQPNEVVIIQSDSVLHDGTKSSYSSSLILTNLHIIHITQGAFEKVKSMQKFPVCQIKIANGQAQILVNKNNNGSLQLQISLSNSNESFVFPSNKKKEIMEWVNGISQLVIGAPAQATAFKHVMAIPGTEQIAATVKDTVGAFKDAFGLKSKNGVAPENITAKCIGCMAPLSGVKGQPARCKYCNTDQIL